MLGWKRSVVILCIDKVFLKKKKINFKDKSLTLTWVHLKINYVKLR